MRACGESSEKDIALPGSLARPAEADRELAKDAIALYQVADDLYMHRRYRIERELTGGR